MQHPTRAKAEHLLRVADKLLQKGDFKGSRDFVVLTQEMDSSLEGPNQILAITNVLIAAEKHFNNHLDWYAILGIDCCSNNIDAIKSQYDRLALLLHPDNSRFAHTDKAFKLIEDAWDVLSNPMRKSQFDKEFSCKTHVGEETTGEENSTQNSMTFWTLCPYCYRLYEYPKVYVDCCLRCQNCERSFTGVAITKLPPLVPGQDAYYCCWGVFPMGFVLQEKDKEDSTGVDVMPP